MAIAASSDALDISPSDASLTGLDWLNFFLAGMQSGFGPFVAVLLAAEGWTQENIGFVLSAGGFAGLLSQLPGGELLDASRSKRLLVALGAGVVALSALVIGFWPKRSGRVYRGGAARLDRRIRRAGYRGDQPRPGRARGTC